MPPTRPQRRIDTGTSGFAFDRWRSGGFYPRSAKPRHWLAHYARSFGFVEVDSTFYRPPSPETLARWCDQVPEGFRFSLKVPREITHESGAAQAGERLGSFLLSTAELQGKLACLLLQFPPHRVADAALLEALLQALPAGLHAAFEFRHSSWFTAAVARRLLDCGKAFCATSCDELAVLPDPGWAYARLPGTGFSRAALGAILRALEARGFAESFVVFRDQARLEFPRDAWLFSRLLPSPAGLESGLVPADA
ncbi:MAG TPA: DUF72 domain-containing protein [Myxococcales bacterium]